MGSSDDFLQLSKALKAAGETELRKQLNKQLKAAVKPVIKTTRAEARKRLPKRGGLADLVAKAPQRVRVRTGATTAGVSLVVAKSNSGARGANRGTVRHPVPGTNRFVDQKVTPGWFDDPAKEAHPDLVEAAREAIDDVAKQIVRRVRG